MKQLFILTFLLTGFNLCFGQLKLFKDYGWSNQFHEKQTGSDAGYLAVNKDAGLHFEFRPTHDSDDLPATSTKFWENVWGIPFTKTSDGILVGTGKFNGKFYYVVGGNDGLVATTNNEEFRYYSKLLLKAYRKNMKGEQRDGLIQLVD